MRAALAEGLETWLREPDNLPFDAREAARFARENTADAFSNTIFSRMTESARGCRRTHSITGLVP